MQRNRAGSARLAFAAAILVETSRVGAAETAARPASQTHDLTFRAGHVTVEGPLSTLTLCDSVEVTVHRYRLTAEQLTLQRTSAGVLVRGPGLVAFCPCEATPITVRFSEANVAPPTDLFIKHAVVRAGGVPVFYTPLLWLRSPNRMGVLSPHFGWRAQDGLWMGSGVHLPFRTSVSEAYVMDVTAGAYLRGGWDVGALLTTPRTTTQIRWDRVQTSFVDVDAHGSEVLESASIGWSADMLRGARARSGFVTAEAAARLTDRSRVEFSHSDGSVVLGAGLRWEAWRAAGLDSLGLMGPQLRLAVGTSLDRLGQVESATSIFAWSSERQRSSMLTVHGTDVGLDARPSVFVARLALHERLTYSSGQTEDLRTAMAGVDARLSLPLVKSWTASSSRWSHWVEPFALVTAAWGRDSLQELTASTERTRSAQIGLTNTVGRPHSDTAYQLELRAGILSSASSTRTTALALRARSSGRWMGVGSDGVLASDRSWLSSSRVRLGDPKLAAFTLRLEGRTAQSWSQQRWFSDEAWVPMLMPWFSRSGWTSIGDAALAPTEWLAVNGGIGGDMTAEKTLFDFAAVAYRHRCGCLAISAMVSERLGRSGWDAWAMVDLMPQ